MRWAFRTRMSHRRIARLGSMIMAQPIRNRGLDRMSVMRLAVWSMPFSYDAGGRDETADHTDVIPTPYRRVTETVFWGVRRTVRAATVLPVRARDRTGFGGKYLVPNGFPPTTRSRPRYCPHPPSPAASPVRSHRTSHAPSSATTPPATVWAGTLRPP